MWEPTKCLAARVISSVIVLTKPENRSEQTPTKPSANAKSLVSQDLIDEGPSSLGFRGGG